MAPITLFFGTNSSGKSSIGQFLMMLKQTVESSDRKAVLYPGDKNSAVHLGSFQKMIFNRNTEEKISFSYEWNLEKELKFRDALSEKKYVVSQIAFDGKIAMQKDSESKIFVENLHYGLKNDDIVDVNIGMERKAGKKEEYEINCEHYLLRRNQGRVWYPGSPVRFYGFPDEVIAYYQNAQFVQSLNLEHEKLFRSVFYLGPLRTKTDRLHFWTDTAPESVGYSGENTVSAMLAARGRRISFGYKKVTRPLEQVIAECLKNMGLIEEFKVKLIECPLQKMEIVMMNFRSI